MPEAQQCSVLPVWARQRTRYENIKEPLQTRESIDSMLQCTSAGCARATRLGHRERPGATPIAL